MSLDDEQRLTGIRGRIDEIDRKLHELINQRATCAREVAEIKQNALDESANADAGAGTKEVLFYRPEREAQVLRGVRERNEGPLPDDEVAHIFREIMSACLALEQPLAVAYLGPEGTFTQAAALKHFGHSARTCPLGSIETIFQMVETGESHYGVVPVENSTEGMVTHTLDSFINSPLHICGEIELPISMHLMISPEAQGDEVTKQGGTLP